MLRSLAKRFDALEVRRAQLFTRVRAHAERDPSVLERIPAGGGWSVRQVIQHLYLVEVEARRQLDAPKARWPHRSLLRRTLVRVFLWSRIRIQAPLEEVVPTFVMTLEELDTSWSALRAGLRDRLAQVTPETATRPSVEHPRAGAMTLPEGMRFLVAHFDHHRPQLDALLATPSR